MSNKKTAQQIWDEKSKFSFDDLLEPYTEGGTQDEPVTRSIGTIFDYLINKKKYPLDVVGASLLITFNELFQGRVFEGDGSYGSKGRELVTYIRMKCDSISQYQLKQSVFETLAGARMEVLRETIFELCRGMIPWFIRIFAPKSWIWLRKRRVAKVKNESS